MSYKPYFQFRDGEWATNAQAFETEGEALKSAAARFSVWTMPIAYEARESDEPVNYRWEGHDVMVDRGELV